MIARWEPTICPGCASELPGLGRYCESCAEYTDRLGSTADTTPAARDRTDTRTEAEVQLAIRRTAEALGYHVYDMSQGRPTRQPSGIPDLYIHGHGRRCWVEVKRPSGGKLSEAQERFLASEQLNGGDAFVARSETDIIRWHEGGA